MRKRYFSGQAVIFLISLVTTFMVAYTRLDLPIASVQKCGFLPISVTQSSSDRIIARKNNTITIVPDSKIFDIRLKPGMKKFYVATKGDDSDPGTLNKPFRTIQKGLDVSQPGDTVLVREGVYNEKVRFSNGGNSSAYITLIAYPNEKPIIDGTGNTFFQIQVPDNTSYVRIIGLQLRNFYAASLSGMSFNESCRNAAIQIRDGCSYIEIRNNIIRDTHNRQAEAISARCYSLSAPITHLLIDGNFITRISAIPGEVVAICGNVDIWQFSNNEMTDLPQGSNGILDPQGGQPYGANASPRHGVCIYNYFHDLQPDGRGSSIYADGSSDNMYDSNIFKNAGFAICFAAEHATMHSDRNIFQNNIIINGNNAAIYTGMWSCCGDPYNPDQIIDNKFLNNITYGGGGWNIHWQRGTVICNNIFYNCGEISVSNSPGTLIDYNLYFNTSASGGDHSKMSDPLFVNAAEGDFHLKPGSPAINAGNNSSGFFATTDYDGKIRSQGSAPDIGVYKYH